MKEYCCPECQAEFKIHAINITDDYIKFCPVCKAELAESVDEGDKRCNLQDGSDIEKTENHGLLTTTKRSSKTGATI